MSAFDAQRLASLANDLGEEDLREIGMEFVAQMNEWILSVKELAADADRPLREVAHAIGSSAAMIGAVPLEQAARALEHHAGAGHQDVDALRQDILARWEEAHEEALRRFG